MATKPSKSKYAEILTPGYMKGKPQSYHGGGREEGSYREQMHMPHRKWTHKLKPKVKVKKK